MKCYGYSTENTEKLLEMAEITLQADPQLLRVLANFMNDCADKIESCNKWEHGHFKDSNEFSIYTELNVPDVIICKANKE